MRSNIATVITACQGALTFSWDMLLNVSLLAEWKTITCNWETLWTMLFRKEIGGKSIMNTLLDNKSWITKTKSKIKGKLAIRTSSPFEIACIYINGTETIQLKPGVTEQINIHHSIPYKDPLIQLKVQLDVRESVVLKKSIIQVLVSSF